MKSLASLGHNPSDRLAAMALAQHYGKELHTGVLYKNGAPRRRWKRWLSSGRRPGRKGMPRERILDMFIQR